MGTGEKHTVLRALMYWLWHLGGGEKRCSSISYKSLIFSFLRSLHITTEILSETAPSQDCLWAHNGFRRTLQRGARAELVRTFFFFSHSLLSICRVISERNVPLCCEKVVSDRALWHKWGGRNNFSTEEIQTESFFVIPLAYHKWAVTWCLACPRSLCGIRAIEQGLEEWGSLRYKLSSLAHLGADPGHFRLPSGSAWSQKQAGEKHLCMSHYLKLGHS